MLVPCQAMGAACRAADTCLEGCAAGLGACLCPSTMPSPLFILFSGVLNAGLIICAVVGLSADHPQQVPEPGPNGSQPMPLPAPDCDDPRKWLTGAIAIAAGNIIFTGYLYWRFARLANTQRGAMDASKQAWRIFAYDVGVFIYLLFAVFVIIWLLLSDSYRSSDDCDENDMVKYGQALGWIYLVGGVFVLGCSVCTECGSAPRYMQQGAGTAAHQQHFYQQPAALLHGNNAHHGGYPAPSHQAPVQQQAVVGVPVVQAVPAGQFYPPPQQQQQQQQQYPPQQQHPPQQQYPPQCAAAELPPQQQQQQRGGPAQGQQQQQQPAAVRAGAAAGAFLGKVIGAASNVGKR
eukprot:TRINITY_DN16755_c0_g3_i2.p3 TRINITY_DN16755_c0_g3~~TRINITY_DN16755_c0_g3_i2.p3  ORF type:complete len:379 (+),score=141.99 TRINITY_DN16755_c0_g3_i2:94-1137(+)